MFKNKADNKRAMNSASGRAMTRNSTRAVSSDGKDGAGFSWIAADIRLKGNIFASNDIHLDGHVEGDIVCSTLVQGPGSVVTGSVKAKSARLAGTVEGTVDVEDLIVEDSGSLTGDIDYCRLSISEGAHLEGQLRRKQAARADAEERKMETAPKEAGAGSPVKLASVKPV